MDSYVMIFLLLVFWVICLLFLAVTISGAVWWAQVLAEERKFSKRTASLGGDAETQFGRVLKRVRCSLDGELIRAEWQFDPDLEGKGFSLCVESKDDGGSWIQAHPATNASGFFQDRMKYGGSRTYRFTGGKRYFALWGMMPWWSRWTTYDAMTFALRSGHIKEAIAFGQDVATLDETKKRMLEASHTLRVAEVEIPLKADQRLAALGKPTPPPLPAARPKTMEELSGELVTLRERLQEASEAIETNANLNQQQREEALSDLQGLFDQAIQKLKEK